MYTWIAYALWSSHVLELRVAYPSPRNLLTGDVMFRLL